MYRASGTQLGSAALARYRDTAMGTQEGPRVGHEGPGGPRALKPSTGVLTVTLSCFLPLVPFPNALFVPFLLQGLSANRCQ